MDAEYDLNYKFSSLKILSKKLRDQNINLSLQIQSKDSNENIETSFELNDENSESMAKSKISDEEEDEDSALKKHRFPIPVIEGTISNIQMLGKTGPTDAMRLYYIKLSIDPRELSETTVKEGISENRYYGRNVAGQIVEGRASKNAFGKCKKRLIYLGFFPQRSTVDQNFSTQQFNAFRDLGCLIIDGI